MLEQAVTLGAEDVHAVELVLQPGAELVVRVDDGSGVPRAAQVRVSSRDGRVVSGLRRWRRLWTWLEHDFDRTVDVLGPLPPGSYRVEASVPGLGVRSMPVELAPGERRELRLTVR